MILFTPIYRIGKRVYRIILKSSHFIAYFKLKLNKIDVQDGFISRGIPMTSISNRAKVTIGRSFIMNNGKYYNMIGRQQPCYLVVRDNAELIIGNNVGISSVAFVCHKSIIIGNNVRIGGGVVIYDSDFHSLKYQDRISNPEIRDNIQTAPVVIKDNVFIGAHSIVLKGVVIGENSVIGAGSVVTKDIPDNCIAAGNPCKVIRFLDDNQAEEHISH